MALIYRCIEMNEIQALVVSPFLSSKISLLSRVQRTGIGNTAMEITRIKTCRKSDNCPLVETSYIR